MTKKLKVKVKDKDDLFDRWSSASFILIIWILTFPILVPGYLAEKLGLIEYEEKGDI